MNLIRSLLLNATSIALLVLVGCASQRTSAAPGYCHKHGFPFASRVMYRVRPDAHVHPAQYPASYERRFPFRIPWYYVPGPGELADIPERVRYCTECESRFNHARRRSR